MSDPLPSLDEWLDDLPDRFVGCRELRHQWLYFRAARLEDGTYFRVLRCRNCKAEREQSLDARGRTIGVKLIYPDGYLAPRGFGRLDADDLATLRLHAVIRHIDKGSKRG